MLDVITSVNNAINSFVWGPIMLTLLVGTGVYLTCRTGWIQVRWFGYIMKHTVGSLFQKSEKETTDNLTPLFTSTIDVKYIGRLYNDEPFDSSYAYTQWGDSILRTTQANLIEGWAIALSDMHVGDSCEILVPYQQAYGSSESGIIKPYSALKFNLKLVDIPYYETKNPE